MGRHWLHSWSRRKNTRKFKKSNRALNFWIVIVVAWIFIFVTVHETKLSYQFVYGIISCVFLLIAFWLNYQFSLLVSLLISVIWVLRFLLEKNRPDIELYSFTSLEGKISDLTNQQAVLKNDNMKIIVFNYQLPYLNLQIDDSIKIEGMFVSPLDDEYSFLNRKDLNIENTYFFKVTKIIDWKKGNSLRNFLYYQTDKINYEYYNQYIDLLFFGQKNMKNELIYDQASILGYVHLFVISGFHIYLLNKLLETSVSKIIKRKVLADFFALSILIFYLYLLNFNLPAMRAWIMIFIRFLYKQGLHKKNPNQFSILAITLLVFFLFNPYLVFDWSLIMSFSTTAIIIGINRIMFLKKYQKLLIMNLVINIFLIPIFSEFNNSWNVLAIIMNLFLTPLIAFVYLNTLWLVFLPALANQIFAILDLSLNFLANIKLLVNISSFYFEWKIAFYSVFCTFFTIFNIYPRKNFYQRKEKHYN